MPIGVSYFGNRILRHVAADMDDLAARGFTGVLHTMSENDLTYYRDTLGRIVEISHAAGLFVQVGPWGLGRTFGGEAESLFVANHPHVGQVLDSGRPVAAGCLNSEAYREFVRSWATAAVETGADRIFWDEPHWAHPAHFEEPLERWGCHCPRCVQRWCDETGDDDMPTELTADVRVFRERCLVEFLGELTAYVASLGGRSTVCLLPHTSGSLGVADWSAVARLPGVATLATDPYWQAFKEPVGPFVTEFSERVAQQAVAAGIDPQIWIQGFRLGPEDADDIYAAVAAARAAGVHDLWTWGYEACGHMSYLGTRAPEQVWEILCDALTGPAPAVTPTPAAGDSPVLCAENRASRGFPLTEPSAGGATDLGSLVTERVRPELADLDLRPTQELVRLMASEEAVVAAAVRRAAPEIASAIDAIVAWLTERPDGRIVYVGAGTAGRMGVLDAAECGPTFNAADKFIALMAGGPQAITKPKEGAEDDPAAGAAELLALGVGPADAVVGISASGRTPYVLGALDAAREAGALTIGLSCHPGSLVSGAADHAIEVVVGAEVIAGSTRLKAGAAQKLVLNTISTVVMIRLGRTFGNLMVDVRAGSEKLVDRARRIVVTAAGVTPAVASAALEAADGEVKTAIVSLLAGVDATAADLELDGDVLRLTPLGHETTPYSPELAAALRAALPPGATTMETVCRLDTAVGHQFAAAAERAARRHPGAELVVAHGQTVFHWVLDGKVAGTLQIGRPAWIAERCGLPVVSDLRSADVAAGGQGAPLVSMFDVLLLGGDAPEKRAALNLGGIANLTVVAATGAAEASGTDGFIEPRAEHPHVLWAARSGFASLSPPAAIAYDAGPANALIDAAVVAVTRGAETYDAGGRRAARGTVDQALLALLLDDFYLTRTPPKTTGKERYHHGFTEDAVDHLGRDLDPDDLIATLTAHAAEVAAAECRRHGVAEIIASGGGTENPVLMRSLFDRLDPARLRIIDDLGIPSAAKEAYAFAVLGFLTWHGLPGNVPSCTGARHPAVLGSITPGPAPLLLPEPVAGQPSRLEIIRG